MAKLMEAQGEYLNKETSEIVTFDFEYLVIDSIDDAVSELGDDKAKSIMQRMIKTDARNGASLKAQAENGHNARAGMTEEQKVENKAKAKANRAILAKLMASGKSIEELLANV